MRKSYLVALVAAPLVLSAGGGFAAGELSTADRSFVDEAASGGLAEVQDAQLAQQKAASNDVKQFAATMIADHTQANDELKQIAQSKGVTPPSRPTRAQQR